MTSLSPIKRTSRVTLSPPKPQIKRKTLGEQSKVKAVNELLSSSVSVVDEEKLVQKSKERVQELAKAVLPETAAVKELQVQMQIRDKYIEILKNKLIDVCVEGKVLETESVFSRERVLQQLYQDKADLLKQIQASEQQNQEHLSKLQSLEHGSTSEKDNYELLIEGLTEESEQLKAQLQAKDVILSSMKQDLAQLSGIIQEMTGLNKDLNDKVVKLNAEMEKKNVEHYQAMAKAQHIDETEKALAEESAERQRLEERVQKLTESTRRIQELESAAIELSTSFSSLETRLTTPELKPQLENLRGILARFQVGSIRKQPESTVLKEKSKQLELELRATNRDLARSLANESALRSRLTTQENETEAMKAEMKETIERLNKTVSTLQNGLSGAGGRMEKVATEYEKIRGDAQKSDTKVANLQAKLEKAVGTVTQANKSETKAQMALKDAQQQIILLKLGKTSQESALLIREQKVKEDAARVKVLTEEVWKRDTLVLKKTAEIFKLEEQLGAMKLNIQQLQGRMKAGLPSEQQSQSHTLAPLQIKVGKHSKPKVKSTGNKSMNLDKSAKDLPSDRENQLFEALESALELSEVLNAGETPSAGLRSLVLPMCTESEVTMTTVQAKTQEIVKELEILLENSTADIGTDVLGIRTRKRLGVVGKGLSAIELIRILQAAFLDRAT